MGELRIVKTWDELPPVVEADGETVSTRLLEKRCRELARVAKALRDAIDSLPEDVRGGIPFSQTGVDRGWVDSIVDGPL